MPFFTGPDKVFLAAIPPSAVRYDWSRDCYCIKRGQRGFLTLTYGCGEHGYRYPQLWRWKTWVYHAGHRYCLYICARREADAAQGYPHLKYYEWRHAIRHDHPMYATLRKVMRDLDHFSGGYEASVAAVRAIFLAHIKAAIDGGEEGYQEFLNKARC